MYGSGERGRIRHVKERVRADSQIMKVNNYITYYVSIDQIEGFYGVRIPADGLGIEREG